MSVGSATACGEPDTLRRSPPRASGQVLDEQWSADGIISCYVQMCSHRPCCST